MKNIFLHFVSRFFFCLKSKRLAPLRKSRKLKILVTWKFTQPPPPRLLRHSWKQFFICHEYIFCHRHNGGKFIHHKKFFLFFGIAHGKWRERERNKSNKHIMACLLCIHTLEKKFFVCFHPDKRFIFPFHSLPRNPQPTFSPITISAPSISLPYFESSSQWNSRNLLFVMMTLRFPTTYYDRY